MRFPLTFAPRTLLVAGGVCLLSAVVAWPQNAGAPPACPPQQAECAEIDADPGGKARAVWEEARERFTAATERLALARERVDAGLVPLWSVTPLVEEVDQARRALDRAEVDLLTLETLAAMVRAEQAALEEPEPEIAEPDYVSPLMEKFAGDGVLAPGVIRELEFQYERRFGAPIPVSARGQTATHRALGYDHQGRVDVALTPDSEEGAWLRRYLRQNAIPYYAFRAFVRGRSTAPHIHIGPPSLRLASAGAPAGYGSGAAE
jgi:hypothetical protein